ncbi:hypothetical protein LCGC14_1724990 [marine sediment metagenome]|uniref:Uncharacterized protein n=1 Tax=marine sediment metagenome TaxID=412755 RepID=A0A0F9KB22_9ZZZZ
MKIALVKISCVNDRLVPLGLACLQAYLKEHSVDVKVLNFRATEYSLPKIASDPLIQLKPPKFVMNHQDFPLLVMIVDTLLFDGDINFDEGIFPDLIEDYANRLCETSNTTRCRFESILQYIKTVILEISTNFTTVGFSIDYLNVVESVICSTLLRLANPTIKIIWGGPTITQSYESYRLWLVRGIVDGLVVGEGEKPLLDISNNIELKNIPGLHIECKAYEAVNVYQEEHMKKCISEVPFHSDKIPLLITKNKTNDIRVHMSWLDFKEIFFELYNLKNGEHNV